MCKNFPRPSRNIWRSWLDALHRPYIALNDRANESFTVGDYVYMEVPRIWRLKLYTTTSLGRPKADPQAPPMGRFEDRFLPHLSKFQRIVDDHPQEEGLVATPSLALPILEMVGRE